MKLSKAQLNLLRELCERGAFHCVEYYPPGMKLVALGLARREGARLSVTEAGRKAMEQQGRV